MKRLFKKILPGAIWTQLRLLRLRWVRWAYQPRKVRHTYAGFPLDLWLCDPLAEGWYDHDWPEPPEIALLRRHGLKKGARVFNLGAHQCVVGLILAGIVGPQGEVLALEANAYNAASGQKNRDLNDAAQLNVLHAAAAERSGKAFFGESFNSQEDDGSGEWGRVEVPAFSIDDLTARYGVPGVLFIDIEGAECQALRGARATLGFRPDCFVEVHVGEGLERFGGSLEEVLSFFAPALYDLFVEASPDDPSGFSPVDREAGLRMDRRFLLVAVRKPPQEGAPS